MSSGSDKSEAEALLSKATSAEQRQDWDLAFRLYIKAAESFLSIVRTSSDEKSRAHCKGSAGRALERAEKIKAVKQDLTPVVVNLFSKDEQSNILRASSFVNGRRYPLWMEPTAHTPTQVYDDPQGQPSLSPEQIRHSAVWRRAIDAIPKPAMISSLLLPDSIIQHIVTDCSLCASLSICLEHHRRFGSKLGLSALYPQDSGGTPYLSESGQYDLRFLFNGGHRRVVIDDKLPIHPNGNLLCMSTKSQQYIWPSLIEKAFMKLVGGYDFPGSNSSIDVHILTGWIPERIEIKSPTFQHELTWRRILTGFRTGRCVCTVGTGDTANVKWRGMNLPASHCYAVIDMREINDERRLSVLSTWTLHTGEGTVDTASSAPQQKILEMSWEDVSETFDCIDLNWDAQQFEHKIEYHGVWLPRNFQADDMQSSTRHLQLQLQIPSIENHSRDVWVLLSRHVIDTRKKTDFIALQVRSEDGYATTSSEIDRVAQRGNYTNSPHILVRTQVSQSTSRSSYSTFSIFVSYDGPSENVGFTITAYSSCSLSWTESVSKALYTSKIDGMFTIKNCGGNSSHPSFMTNPQYHLCIRPGKQQPSCSSRISPNSKAHVVLALQGPKDIPLNLMVVWSKGQRIIELVRKEIVTNSGPYNYGFARLSSELPAGDYSVIVSAYEPQHTGPFTLRMECSHPFDLKAIPQEGAGMYSKTVRGAWNERNAMGSPSFDRYLSNPIFVMVVPCLTELIVRLQLPSAVSLLNITLFRTSDDDLLGGQVATSGPYSDAISGVVIPRISLKPGKYWLVPSTYSPGVLAEFRVVLYSSAAGVDVSTKESN